MLKHLQTIAGYVVLVIGLFVGFAMGNVMVILASVTSGLILMALGRIIGIAEEIQYKVLEIPSTGDQIRTVIRNSPQYLIETADFEVYPDRETRYPLLVLDDESYIRARLFYKYLSQSQSNYTFRLPEQAPIILQRSEHYYKGVDLFACDEQVFVKLRTIHYRPVISGNKLIMERTTS